MNDQLPADITQRVEACFLTGIYRSNDEVLRDALDALDEREQDTRQRWHAGNQVAIELSRLGMSRPLDDRAILQRLYERLAAEGITD